MQERPLNSATLMEGGVTTQPPHLCKGPPLTLRAEEGKAATVLPQSGGVGRPGEPHRAIARFPSLKIVKVVIVTKLSQLLLYFQAVGSPTNTL